MQLWQAIMGEKNARVLRCVRVLQSPRDGFLRNGCHTFSFLSNVCDRELFALPANLLMSPRSRFHQPYIFTRAHLETILFKSMAEHHRCWCCVYMSAGVHISCLRQGAAACAWRDHFWNSRRAPW